MPWKVSNPVNERMRFVLRREAGERMTDLCQEYGISRRTGYKFWNRYLEIGPIGLYDEPRRAHNIPWTTAPEIRALILELKAKQPTWGAKKLKSSLERAQPGLRIPAVSTIQELLSKNGLVKRRRKRHRATPSLTPLTEGESPNSVWSADFKGQFRLGNRSYCYPLTISDHFSRYFLACEALENTRGPGTKRVFERAFKEYGLPNVIRVDNGAPFASSGLAGLTRLSVWWHRLDIQVERIEPGHPEQNGRHERLHRTLKEETARPGAGNILQQQERFDRFVEVYNRERPHEALGMGRPADFYESSERRYRAELPDLEYPLHDLTKRVTSDGHISWRRKKNCYIGMALAGETLGLREVDDDQWLVTFLSMDLGHIDGKTRRFEPLN